MTNRLSKYKWYWAALALSVGLELNQKADCHVNVCWTGFSSAVHEVQRCIDRCQNLISTIQIQHLQIMKKLVKFQLKQNSITIQISCIATKFPKNLQIVLFLLFYHGCCFRTSITFARPRMWLILKNVIICLHKSAKKNKLKQLKLSQANNVM